MIFQDVTDLCIWTLLQKYRNITIEGSLAQPGKRDVHHHIDSTGSPIFPKVRLLQKLVIAWFKQLLKQGILRPSNMVNSNLAEIIDALMLRRFVSGTPLHSSKTLRDS